MELWMGLTKKSNTQHNEGCAVVCSKIFKSKDQILRSKNNNMEHDHDPTHAPNRNLHNQLSTIKINTQCTCTMAMAGGMCIMHHDSQGYGCGYGYGYGCGYGYGYGLAVLPSVVWLPAHKRSLTSNSLPVSPRYRLAVTGVVWHLRWIVELSGIRQTPSVT